MKVLGMTAAAGALSACGASSAAGSAGSAASTSAAGASSAAASTAAAGNGSLVVGLYGGLDSLNPWSNGRITKDMVTYVLYETLASCQSGSTEIDKILLKDYTKVDDTTFDMEIYDSIKDVAGNAVKASDVVFSFNQYSQNWANTMESITATGDFTLELKLNTAATGAFEYLICKVPIAAEQSFNASSDQLATTSAGTMPYSVAGGADYVNGTKIIARRVGSYWQTDASLVYPGSVANADTIEFDILEESTQLALAVKNGDVQVAFYIDPSLLDEVSKYDGVKLIEMPSSEDRGIMFCMTETSPFYDDLALRQAVLYAIDNDSVASACGYGYGTGANVMCGSEELTVGFNKAWETSPYKYDPAKAKELLAQSKYDGRTLELLCNSNALITMMWQIVQSDLSAVGIKSELKVVEGTTYGAYRDGTSGQYDLAYAGPGNGGYVTSDLWNTLFNRNNYSSGRTWAGLKDDKLQALYDAIAAPNGYTQDNLDAFYNYIVDNALYYKIYSLSDYAAMNTNVCGDYYIDWNRFIRANTIQLK